MPLRQDPSLPWNLPGCVAYYQPVRAPDSLLARYNMAHGGDNRFRAMPGVQPTWSAKTGWGFNGSQYLDCGVNAIVPGWAAICAFTNVPSTAGKNHTLFGSATTSYNQCFIIMPWRTFGGIHRYYNGSVTGLSVAGVVASGVLAISGAACYQNGVFEGNAQTSASAITPNIYIGCYNDPGSGPFDYVIGNIQSFVIYSRLLSPAEVWQASRQMQYCDVNPDWSVWSPRRKWFPYVLAGGGFQAAWAERANRLIGGG